MDTKIHFSTGNDNYETPDALYKHYDDIYHFVLDAAADSHNHKCPVWFGLGGTEPDALTADWPSWLKKGNIWMNPPYSRGLQAKFVNKAMFERTELHHVVCLLPARTDTKLFHETIQPFARKIEFLRGRVKFKGAKAGAPFPSMIVVF